MTSASLRLYPESPAPNCRATENRLANEGSSLSGQLKWCAHAIISFEMVVAVLVTLGAFKAKSFVERIQELIHTDITIAVMGVAVLLFAHTVLNYKDRISAHAIDIGAAGGLFVGYILLSLMWTASIDYASNKMVRVGGIISPIFVFSVFAIAPDRERRQRIVFCVSLMGTLLGLDTLWTYLSAGRSFSFDGDMESNSVGLGVILGVTITILFAQALLLFRRFIPRMMVMGLLVMLSWGLLTTGARGPLLATVVACVALIVYGAFGSDENRAVSRQSIRNYGVLVIVLVVASMVFYVSYTGEAPRMFRRLEVLTQEQGGDAGGRSVGMRMIYWSEAVRIAMERPIFGGGIGSFPVLTGHADARMYPHNVVLETACELGLVGLLLLGLFAFAIRNAIFSADRDRSDPYRLINLCLLLNLVTASMFSMDLGEHRMLALVIGLQAGASLELESWQQPSFQPA